MSDLQINKLKTFLESSENQSILNDLVGNIKNYIELFLSSEEGIAFEFLLNRYLNARSDVRRRQTIEQLIETVLDKLKEPIFEILETEDAQTQIQEAWAKLKSD